MGGERVKGVTPKKNTERLLLPGADQARLCRSKAKPSLRGANQLAHASLASRMGVAGSILQGNQQDCGCNRRKGAPPTKSFLEDARRILLSNSLLTNCIEPVHCGWAASKPSPSFHVGATSTWTVISAIFQPLAERIAVCASTE